MEEDEDKISDDMLEAYKEVKNKKALIKIGHNMKKKNRANGKNNYIVDVLISFLINYY